VGWLFTSTRYADGKIVRGERRRRIREQKAHTMHELNYEAPAYASWAELRPVVDEVMASLCQLDREAVLLRFFEGVSFAEVGARFAISGDAARLRVERALEKMHVGLARHGVKSTTSALALALANQPAVAVPAGLAATLTGAALIGTTAAGSVGTAITLMSIKSTFGVAGAISLLVVGGFTVFQGARQNSAITPPAPAATPPREKISGSNKAEERLSETPPLPEPSSSKPKTLVRAPTLNELLAKVDSRETALVFLNAIGARNSVDDMPASERPKIRFIEDDELSSQKQAQRTAAAVQGRQLLFYVIEGEQGIHAFDGGRFDLDSLPAKVRTYLTAEDLSRFQDRITYMTIEQHAAQTGEENAKTREEKATSSVLP
jgi:hypothetical protein